MAEIAADVQQRWYRVRWPGESRPRKAWVEKFFDNHNEAFRYYEEREREIAPRRVHTPMHSVEDASIWVVCVEPA